MHGMESTQTFQDLDRAKGGILEDGAFLEEGDEAKGRIPHDVGRAGAQGDRPDRCQAGMAIGR